MNFYSQKDTLAGLGFYAVPKTEFPEYFAEEIAALESSIAKSAQPIPAEKTFPMLLLFVL